MSGQFVINEENREEFLRKLEQYKNKDIPEGTNYCKITATLLWKLLNGDKMKRCPCGELILKPEATKCVLCEEEGR